MSARTVRICVLACTLTLATAACGSSKSGTSVRTAPSTAAAAPTASGSPAPSSTTTSTAPAIASSGSDADFCKLGGPTNAALAFAAVTEGGADVGKLRHDLAQAEAQAPSEIKADVQTIADVETPILDGKVPQAQIEQQLNDHRIVAAMQHISSWSIAHCKQ